VSIESNESREGDEIGAAPDKRLRRKNIGVVVLTAIFFLPFEGGIAACRCLLNEKIKTKDGGWNILKNCSKKDGVKA
jgi:hypothetical protein